MAMLDTLLHHTEQLYFQVTSFETKHWTSWELVVRVIASFVKVLGTCYWPKLAADDGVVLE